MNKIHSTVSRRSSNETQKSPKVRKFKLLESLKGIPPENAELRGKFRGCLIGALIGDCLGTLFENDFSVNVASLKDLYTTLINPPILQIHQQRKQESKGKFKERSRTVSSSNSIPEDEDVAQHLQKVMLITPPPTPVRMDNFRSRSIKFSLEDTISMRPKKFLTKKHSITDGYSNKPLERFSDDTVQIKSVLSSLIRCHDLDPKDMARQLTEDYFLNLNRKFSCFLRDVFVQLRDNRYSDPFGPAKSIRGNLGSQGNGSSARVCAMALYDWNHEPITLIENATRLSKITHGNKFGINGACLQALAVNLALKWDRLMEVKKDKEMKKESSADALLQRQNSLDFDSFPFWENQPFDIMEFVNKLLRKMDYIESGRYSIFGNLRNLVYSREPGSPSNNSNYDSYTEKLIIIQEFLTRPDPPPKQEIVEKLGNGKMALNSVPTALYCFLFASLFNTLPDFDFEIENPVLRTIFYAISLGGDTDSIACMAGAISGSYWGYNTIPNEVIEACEDYDTIIKLSDELYDISFPKRK